MPCDYLAYFRDRAGCALGLDLNRKKKERIYVSRASAPKRRILNEEELIRTLEPYEFKAVELGSMTLAQQAQLFRDAEFVIGPHGAGLTNILFSNSCGVLELFPGACWNHYRWLAHAAGLRYGALVAGDGGKHDDFHISPRTLIAKIRAMSWIT
jgi:capsular polysaccharide biosynthesis protein